MNTLEIRKLLKTEDGLESFPMDHHVVQGNGYGVYMNLKDGVRTNLKNFDTGKLEEAVTYMQKMNEIIAKYDITSSGSKPLVMIDILGGNIQELYCTGEANFILMDHDNPSLSIGKIDGRSYAEVMQRLLEFTNEHNDDLS